ncbi:MAG TPA: S41 family peptidase [Allosphingosinicella sp.]|nr:S41 family peptidase [Allosphingosinicella sp.]
MNRAAIMSIVAAVSAVPATAQLQAGAPRQASTATAQRAVHAQAVVGEVRKILAERYVLPERRPALDAVLAEGLSSGRYRVTDPRQLATLINADLERVGKDKHLNFDYNPDQATMMAAGRRETAPDNSGYERMVRGRNHGIMELKVLPGNVRYMDYRGFDWIGPETAAALDTAMNFLAGGDAVIIDIRRNGGGSPAAVQYITSHFMEAGKPLMTFHMNGEASPDTTATLTELKAPRMIGKPLYVLTSGSSASAAEEFAGHVAGYKLGELVGETTAGAGFRNDLVPIAGQFVLSVSVGRAVLAATGKDWEAVGHAPSMKAPVSNALETAQSHALRRLAATAPERARPQMLALADGFAAKTERRAAALPLAAYAGTYGERTVSLDGDRLYYQRGSGMRQRLIALGGNRFAFEEDPSFIFTFMPAGAQAAAMEMGPAGAPPQGRYDRSAATATASVPVAR